MSLSDSRVETVVWAAVGLQIRSGLLGCGPLTPRLNIPQHIVFVNPLKKQVFSQYIVFIIEKSDTRPDLL